MQTLYRRRERAEAEAARLNDQSLGRGTPTSDHSRHDLGPAAGTRGTDPFDPPPHPRVPDEYGGRLIPRRRGAEHYDRDR